MNEPTRGWAGEAGESCSQPAPELQAGLPHAPHATAAASAGTGGAPGRGQAAQGRGWSWGLVLRPRYLWAIRDQVRTRTQVSSGQRQEGQKKTLGGGPRGPFAERRGCSRDRESSRLSWGPACVSYTESQSCPDQQTPHILPAPAEPQGPLHFPGEAPRSLLLRGTGQGCSSEPQRPCSRTSQNYTSTCD